jgi:H+-transporting ATPase
MPPSTLLASINNLSPGLTATEARLRLARIGPNAMPDAAANPWRIALTRFGAPVPWMLELAIAVEVILGDYIQGAVIALL